MQRGLSPQGVTVMITEGGAKPVCPQAIAKANPTPASKLAFVIISNNLPLKM
jgi:hypothetical protein